MRYLYLALLLFYPLLSSAQPAVKKTYLPAWIHALSPSGYQPSNVQEGGFQYLLIDQQVNLPRQTAFFHYAAQVFTAEGVQSLSDISIDFDPTFQRLHLHKLQLRRAGTVIDKLAESQVRTIQREIGLERSLYDGSLTAIINLSDVRPSDIIEYSYSLVGFNPIYQGHFATTLYQQHPVPVNRIYYRLIARSKQKIHLKHYQGAKEPTVTRSPGQVTYVWDIDALDYHITETNLPPSVDPFRRVALSTYNSWQEVAAWATPFYTYDKSALSAIARSLPDAYDQERKLLSLVQLVQDDIRYLGFEGGINGYKPHAPAKVFKQRYGDCKDKSLLLAALLRHEGIEANPLLVNTQLRGSIRDLLPSPHAFDHCVVHFRYQGNEYLVDPTISAQGGDLAHRSFPDYEQGLLIKPGSTELIDLPQPAVAELTVREIIQVDSIGGAAHLVVRSEYSGDRADNVRRQFQTQRKADIEQSYLDFYRNLYPSVVSKDTIRLYDYDRATLNKVIVEESYQIPQFWEQSQDGESLQAELSPIVLASQLGYPAAPARPQPYYLGTPYSYSQITRVEMPEAWPVTPGEQHIAGPGFSYYNQIQGRDNVVTIHHRHSLNQSQIPGDSIAALLDRQKLVENEASFFLTYNPSLAGFRISWIALFIILLVAGAGTWLAVRIYRRYDPPAWRYAEDKSIGSWLVLPALGITVTPFLLVRDLWTEGYFNQNTWQAIISSEQSFSFALVVGIELVYNVLFIVFTLLVIVLFYQRRTSVPRLVTIFYALSLVVPMLDGWLVDSLLDVSFTEQEQQATYKEIGRSFLAAAVWIPYFNFSERVKSTFCRQRSSLERTVAAPSETIQALS